MEYELLALVSVMAWSVWTDIRDRRIPNRLIVLGLVAAFGMAMTTRGWPGLGSAAIGAGAGLGVLLPFFLLRLVGAGDVKLLAVAGAFVGTAALWPVVFYSLLAGGVLGLVACMHGRTLGAALGNVKAVVFAAALKARGAPIALHELGVRSAVRVPYSVAIAAGVACWILTRG